MPRGGEIHVDFRITQAEATLTRMDVALASTTSRCNASLDVTRQGCMTKGLQQPYRKGDSQPWGPSPVSGEVEHTGNDLSCMNHRTATILGVMMQELAQSQKGRRR